MKRKTLTATSAAAAIALVATALVAGPSLAHGPGGGQYFGGPAQQGQAGYGMMGHMGPGSGSGWGPGAAGRGMGPGMGSGMGPGAMGYGHGPGAMGYGAMGYGAMGYGANGSGDCPAVQAAQGKDLTVEGVTAFLERRLTWQGNDRLKVGEVSEQGDDAIVAEIVTKDGSLVDRLTFDRHSGRATRAE